MIEIESLAGGVIVSCQARSDNPLHGPVFMTAMAVAAVAGGAVGIRANGVPDVSAIHAKVAVPILGIHKILDGRAVYITPTFEVARDIVAAGADIVALDATLRDRDDAPPVDELIKRIRGELDVRVMADCDSLESAEQAARAGSDLISTTLSGYTGGTVPLEPDLQLITDIAQFIDTPVVAEGRLWSPNDVAAAFAAGAWSVVVGTAITNPLRITARLVAASPYRSN